MIPNQWISHFLDHEHLRLLRPSDPRLHIPREKSAEIQFESRKRRVTTFRRQGSRNGLEGRNAGKRDEVRLEEGRKEEEEEEDEEESSQRAPRTERVSSLAQGQALLLERERSNISGIGERKKRG